MLAENTGLGSFAPSVRVAQKGFIYPSELGWAKPPQVQAGEGTRAGETPGGSLEGPQGTLALTSKPRHGWMLILGSFSNLNHSRKEGTRNKNPFKCIFHPAQNWFPQIQGHPTSIDPFIKYPDRFVRVNSNIPVRKKKSVVFSWREWSFLVMFNLVSKDAWTGFSLQTHKVKLGSKISSLCKMCMYIKLLGIVLTYLNYHKNKWCTKTFPASFFFFFPLKK